MRTCVFHNVQWTLSLSLIKNESASLHVKVHMYVFPKYVYIYIYVKPLEILFGLFRRPVDVTIDETCDQDISYMQEEEQYIYIYIWSVISLTLFWDVCFFFMLFFPVHSFARCKALQHCSSKLCFTSCYYSQLWCSSHNCRNSIWCYNDSICSKIHPYQ